VPSATALDQADRPWNRPGVSLANAKFGITLRRTSPCGPDREARGGLRDRSLPVSDACIRSFLVDRRSWSTTRSQRCCAMRPMRRLMRGKASAVPKYRLTEMFELVRRRTPLFGKAEGSCARISFDCCCLAVWRTQRSAACGGVHLAGRVRYQRVDRFFDDSTLEKRRIHPRP
jgi:hypothetical protein